jgi:tRNA pseudouridine38-40 synthase
MPNIKLTLEYNGTQYYGWQRQRDRPTLQGSLEKKINQLTGEWVKVIGAGRTDAGVHAFGQVANFKSNSTLSKRAWQRALNRLLPKDIVIRKVEEADKGFHARYDAREKVYRYFILNRSYRTAIERQYRWVVYPKLDVGRMRKAARPLRGRHDFSSFRSGTITGKTSSSICTVKKISVDRKRDEIILTIVADRFLQQMVRTIVGTLIEVGRGKRNPDEVARILQSKDRRQAGQTAPPLGLFLMKVKY